MSVYPTNSVVKVWRLSVGWQCCARLGWALLGGCGPVVVKGDLDVWKGCVFIQKEESRKEK